MRIRLLLLALLLFPVAAAPAALETPEQIEQCVEDNFPEKTSRQSVTFTAVDRTGGETVSSAEILWRKFGEEKSRALIRFSAPPDLRGSSVLLIEKGDRADMFMYLPELRKVRRVNKRSLSGSMFGTDFSYEDFERIQGMSDELESQRLPDGEVEGRAVYVLDTKPARQEDSQYERVKTYVDQERCVILRAELFEKGDRLRKVLTVPAEKLTQEGSIWVPRLTRVDDQVDETWTSLVVDEIEVNVKLPRKLFTETELQKGN